MKEKNLDRAVQIKFELDEIDQKLELFGHSDCQVQIKVPECIDMGIRSVTDNRNSSTQVFVFLQGCIEGQINYRNDLLKELETL